MKQEQKKTFEEINNIYKEDLIKGFIQEMVNYGFDEEFIGKYIAIIINVLESENEN